MRIFSGRELTVSACLVFRLATGSLQAAEEFSREAIVSRVRGDIEYFASDDQEGRGIETKGIERSAERIIAEYQKFGLQPAMPDGSFRQPFDVSLGDVVISESTHAKLTAPDGTVTELKPGDEFQPIRRGANGQGAVGRGR